MVNAIQEKPGGQGSHNKIFTIKITLILIDFGLEHLTNQIVRNTSLAYEYFAAHQRLQHQVQRIS